MGAKFTYDFSNRLFVLDQVAPDGNGQVTIDVQVDLYSDWKEDLISGVFNGGVIEPFRTTAGDPVSPGKKIAPYFFLINGWAIRPYEADHTLFLVGNLFADPDTNAIAVPTVGGYMVNVVLQRAVDALGVDAVNVGSIYGSVSAAQNLSRGSDAVVHGTAVAGALSTTQMSCDINEVTTDHFKGRVIIWLTGPLAYQQAEITGFAGWNGSYSTLLFPQVTDTPQAGNEFIIV